MYLDKETQLSAAQAVTVSAASTNVIDLGASRDVGVSGVDFVLTVNQAAAAAGAATVAASLQGSNDPAFGTFVTLDSTGPIGKADLVANRKPIYLRVRPGATPYRYLRGYYDVATGPLTAGQFSLIATEEPEALYSYKSGTQ